MRHMFYMALGTALLLAASAQAQYFSPGPQGEQSFYPGPSAELSSGAMASGKIAPPSLAQRRQALASAKLPSPNGPGTIVPNGPLTANPPGAGASSEATLMDHGELGTTGAANTHVETSLAENP